MIKILNNPDINWNAISAITNIFVVIATFITLIVTIWLSIRNTTPKGKIAIGISDKAYIHFINTGVVNITLLGMYISLKRKDSINSVLGQRIEKTLYPSENFEFGIPHNRLSALLIEKKYKINYEVELYVNLIDSYRRVHTRKFIYKIHNPEIEVRLNTSHRDKE